MTTELPKAYDPAAVEQEVYARWTESGAFHAEPGCEPRDAYCIVIPPPNVTAPLHLGHALNNALQDVLVRCRRMQGKTALWMPGTDHAGIATQTVVEKRILAEEGKRRTDFPREAFVERIQSWKDEYEARITKQLQTMGCSCDWRRQRFTMDEVCARAVRETFFRLFRDGLIYRGKRLVNWDPATQTVLADDEVEHEQVHGHFWYMRYPLVEPVVCSEGVPPSCTEGVSPSCAGGVPPSYDQPIEKRPGHHLPHWTRQGATYAVTFRLADSVPQEVSETWQRERREIHERAAAQGRDPTYDERVELNRLFSDRIDSLLDAGRGECLLREPAVAEMVRNALKHFDGDRYELIAWAIMPNHVHAVVRPLPGFDLSGMLHSWKSYTAKEANRILGREGRFWMQESYDHLIRDEKDFNTQVQYVLANPAKAGLEDWPWVGSAAGRDTRGQDGLGTRRRDAFATSAQHAAHPRGQDGLGTRRRDAFATETITHVTVATTRPETMLGDTAVAMNPADPRADALIGKKVRLPIVGREIPIIADEHVVMPDPDSEDEKARFGTGFLKVTPAHDPDDYQIGQRHDLPMVNVMAPDGSISDAHGWEDCDAPEAQNLVGMDRFEAREAVVEFFRQEGLLSDVREYVHQVGHSYRSHVPIEPYLSDQWYVAVKRPSSEIGERSSEWAEQHPELVEQRGGTAYLKDTDVPVNSLAGLALAPLLDGRLKFTPDRYARTYQTWLENLRDWPISRQLWWGHRIPVWSAGVEQWDDPTPVAKYLDNLRAQEQAECFLHGENADTTGITDAGLLRTLRNNQWPAQVVYVCPREDDPAVIDNLDSLGFKQDPDVLDTWFSSALWPFSTMGWPEDTPELGSFYPGDVLCTAREIITLWVSRMVMMGQYCVGDIPFEDVFIHAMIQDGQGRKMSKSLGNGIDPLDIIDSHGADAMRYTLVSMTTQTQDVRMPVEEMTMPDGRKVNSSPKFDVGRNFCNKLWNASRFALMNLGGCPLWSDIRPHEHLADRWLLSRLNATIRDVTAAVDEFRFNEIGSVLYHFVWDDFCDWYLEVAKGRINAGEPAPKAVLAHALDVILRLLHPVAPFITEAIWAKLNEVAPTRGPGDASGEPLLATASWPRADAAARDEGAERSFAALQEMIRGIRDARQQHNVPPSRKVAALIEATGETAERVERNRDVLCSQASLGELTLSAEPVEPPRGAAAVAAGGAKLYVLDIIDVEAEKARLGKQKEGLLKGIRAAEGKLGNESFVSKAPAEVVQRERDRLAEMQTELDAIEKSLAALA